jgi:hypothetical protein
MAGTKSVAVVAHSGKTLGGGLSELRKVLAAAGYGKPIWYEVPKSRKAPKVVRRAVKKGAKLIFVWGGDGMVQRCIDALAGFKKVEMAILPAGTANLLATNLGIPKDIAKAVRIGLHGTRRKLDVGILNGERFAVMAGTGFDVIMMRGADGAKKQRLGRLAYIRSGVKAMQAKRVRLTVRVDGENGPRGGAPAASAGARPAPAPRDDVPRPNPAARGQSRRAAHGRRGQHRAIGNGGAGGCEGPTAARRYSWRTSSVTTACQSEHPADHEQDQEHEEQDLGNPRRAGRESTKSEDGSRNGNQEKNERVVQHGAPPFVM